MAQSSLATTRSLLKYGANVHLMADGNVRYTALHLAAEFGDPGTVETLVKAGADATMSLGPGARIQDYILTPLPRVVVWEGCPRCCVTGQISTRRAGRAALRSA